MNERIKEIAEQAKQYARERMAHTMNPMLFSAEVFQEKFAELIVKECAKISEECGINLNKEDFRQGISRNIKQHFGVEE